ncbi:S8 family serine peptidase [Micromonospora sp. S4605]|uniref:S8 family serine peptidase n=1 Tax=Micromonospora sp. S4605 TaxID=1420897 RepID=UPI001305260C|nr:S8 family serine peptidase [Micromonospora sp. S4605]
MGTVVLITGDRVAVARDRDGSYLATLLPGDDGTRANVTVVRHDADVYVIPTEAQSYIAAGSLDRELFNVTGLLGVPSGQDAVPLIVEYDEGPGVGTLASRRPPAHSKRTAALESIDALAVTVSTAEAARFWSGIKRTLPTGTQRSTGGISKVWLDPVLKPDLAESVRQIGAPTAWTAGFDGTGARVAVLDTGYDPTHPDLAGQVVRSADFSGTGITDGHGHGTHVASTVAGTGAASGGRYVGVAPGADLLVGKVMTNEGSGMGSWLIDGMEWAVANGATVVNMSLSTEVTDGTDPMSQAVNELSASSDTLFVATSGNTGPDELTARAPGNADAALSVAAVDRSDSPASFSSRGPRAGDYAVKPDIAGPGVGIVAARAEGTTLGTPVGERYVTASGTSMAAPHVAGAAAIVKQRHPEWDGEQIKATLMGSSASVAGASVYDVGAGRVDVARAVAQPVTASPGSVSFGRYAWSEEDRDDVTRTIVYRNSGDRALTLGLTIEAATTTGAPAPAGMFTTDASTVTVPAGGSAEVRLTLDPDLGDTGLYGGQVRATAEDGTTVHTSLGVFKEPRMVELVVEGIAQDGSAAAGGSSVDLWNLDTGRWTSGIFGGKGGAGPAVFSVPVGTYSLTSFLWTMDDAGAFGREIAMVSKPEITLTEDTRIVLDGRTGQRLDPVTPQPSEARQITIGYHRASGRHSFAVHYLLDRYVDAAYATETEPVTRGEFELSSHWELYAPEFTMKLAGVPATLEAEYSIGSPRIDGRRTYDLVDAGRATPQDVAGRDLSGKLAVIERSDAVSVAEQVRTVGDAGAAAAIVYHDRPGFLLAAVPTTSPIPSFTIEQAPGRDLLTRLSAGPAKLQIAGTPDSPYVYDLFPYHTGHVPAAIDRTVEHLSLARTAASYHASGAPQRGAEVLFPRRPYDSFVLRRAQEIAVPSARTEWASPGDVVWRPMTWHTVSQDGGLIGSPRSYTAGQKRTEDWFRPVVRPGVPAVGDEDDARWGIPGYRSGDQFTIQIRSLLDSGEHYSERAGDSESRLYRDGELVAERGGLEGTWPASAEHARYRLELDVRQSEPWWQHSTSSHTAWGFTSSRPAGGQQLLDLLQIDYDVPTDLNGDVAAGEPTEVGLRVYPQARRDQPADVSLRVWASHDAGGTWREVDKVKAAGDGSFVATVAHPKGAETVSLRVVATGGDGASIDQTVIRAFGVAGS